MNIIANEIKTTLSLREPLQASLDIVAQVCEALSMQKPPSDTEESSIFLKQELEKVKTLFPIFKDFGRDFPSLAFSIATGVGKTRLMGAIIAYLHLQKGNSNFFILAPNLTIYEKLIQDFGNPAYHKYVFSGIPEFVINRPVIITGDNYTQQGILFKDKEIRINIFNVAKFNADSKGNRKAGEKLAPKIKRISEYLGQSYWEYLSNLDDLVMLMDEAHRYHADASKTAINELKPVLGIELTATPFDENGQIFKNIIYEYTLGHALEEGKFVKNPAIATRLNIDRQALKADELEIMKLEDAVSIHKDTKNELEIYARNNDVILVKPFILVVCRDISHAKNVFNLVSAKTFYEGEFEGKVLQIDSSTKKEEEIERQFIALESPDNIIEIVIHVNMLKEGWDVTNLYTIVPLRAANAQTLVEQTIGRGLRLPYKGARTGIDKVDKLTIVAHENFEAILMAANDPNSILKKMSFITLSPEDLSQKTEIISSKSISEHQLETQQTEISKIKDIVKKEVEQKNLDAKKAILNVISDNNILNINNIADLDNEKIKEKVIQEIEKNLAKGQQNVFAEAIKQEARHIYSSVVAQYKKNIIEIPRINLVAEEITAIFDFFDLNTSDFNFQALEQEIIRQGLTDRKVEKLRAELSGYLQTKPVDAIVIKLMDEPSIDYDANSELLYHLATQALAVIQENIKVQKKFIETILQFKTTIAKRIYLQMQAHFRIERTDVVPEIHPFSKIEQWNFTKFVNEGYKDYRDAIKLVGSIPKYVFRGFEKACHFEYKFDSKTELDLAFVLENDKGILKWLRPAPNQFRIYWDNSSKRYEPDFVAETIDTIYIIETKAASSMADIDVLEKQKAAQKYCQYATNYTSKNSGKMWKYLLIPHDEVRRNVSFDYLKIKFL